MKTVFSISMIPVLAANLFTGCTLMPDYKRPSLPVSDQWPQEDVYRNAGTLLEKDGVVTDIGWRTVFRSSELHQMIQKALDNNRDLRVASLRVEQARALYRVERSALFPAVSASAGLSRQGVPSNASSTEKDSVLSTYSANIASTSYELDLFGRVRSLNAQALELYLATEEAQKAVRVSLISEVANVCLTYWADSKGLKITEETLHTQEETYAITKRRHDLGVGSQLDMEQVRVSLETARANRARYVRQVAQDRNALALLLGGTVDLETLDALTLDTVKIYETIPVGLPSTLLLERPDVLQAEHALRAANANIGAARAAFFPVISLTGSAGLASERLIDLFKSGSALAWTFSPQATLPIFDAGRNHANLSGAKAAQATAVAQYEQAVQTAFREVADQLAARGTYTQQWEAQREAVKAADRAYKLSFARYEQGTDSYLYALVAQRDLYYSQLSEVSIQQERMANFVNLYKVLGGGKMDTDEPIEDRD